MSLFVEGVESITLACTLVILVPTLALALTTRNSFMALAGSIIGTAALMWARAASLWTVEADGAVNVVLGAAIVAIFTTGWALPRRTRQTGFVLGLLGGAVAAWLWRPCVGEHFAETLRRSEDRSFIALFEMHVYVAALLLPVLLLVAMTIAIPVTAQWIHHRRVRQVALMTGVAYAVTVAIGKYDDLVGELFRLSSG